MTLSGKKILVGITGGIAAYKICGLIRQFVRAGTEVKAVLTPNALNFVTETTLRTLTGNPVYIEQFQGFDANPEHISLADWGDVFVIAPASANTMSKIACGICDNLLISVLTAFKEPVVIVPAMNTNMWNNPIIQENIAKLEKTGYIVVQPESGELACGCSGAGRLANIDDILNKTQEILAEKDFLKGKKILVTAGGTKEPIDPVRFIGNRSSGKMGAAIADAAWGFGAEVCLISTVKDQKPYKTITVNTAQEMHNAVMSEFPACDMLIMAAAVADYRPKEYHSQKIKKSNSNELNIELVKNPDILDEAAKIKKPGQVIVGFCAETDNLLEHAKHKLGAKNLDFIIANDVSGEDIGFDSDYNQVKIINNKNKNPITIDRMKKRTLAKIILKNLLIN